MTHTRDEAIADALTDYTGVPTEPGALQYRSDPLFPGVVAVRHTPGPDVDPTAAITEPEHLVGYLVKVTRDSGGLGYHVHVMEEVEFTCWPPTSFGYRTPDPITYARHAARLTPRRTA